MSSFPVEKEDCEIRDEEGRFYTGHQNMTQNEEPCLKWSEVDSKLFKGEGDHNYCRNPMKLANHWCYYQDTEKKVSKGKCAVVTCGKDNVNHTLAQTLAKHLPIVHNWPRCKHATLFWDELRFSEQMYVKYFLTLLWPRLLWCTWNFFKFILGKYEKVENILNIFFQKCLT